MKTMLMTIILLALAPQAFASYTYYSECKNIYTVYEEGIPQAVQIRSKVIKGVTFNDKANTVVLDMTTKLPNTSAGSIFTFDDYGLEMIGKPSSNFKKTFRLENQNSVTRNYKFQTIANLEDFKNFKDYKGIINLAVTRATNGVGKFIIIENYLYEKDFSVDRQGDSNFYLSFNTTKDTSEARYFDNRYGYAKHDMDIVRYYSKRNRTLYIELKAKIQREDFNKVICYIEN